MLSRGNYFSGQSNSEKVVLFVRRHWMSFAPWLAATIFLFILPIIIYLFVINDFQIVNYSKITLVWLVVFLGAYYLFIVGIFLKSWVGFYLNVTIVTTEHLVDIRQVKLFDRRVAEQSLLRVQDVSSKMSGLFQTFFHYGRVLVETAGDTPNFEIQSVPKPYIVASTIMKLHQDLVDGGFRHSEEEGEGTFKRDFVADLPSKAKKIDPKKDEGEIDLPSYIEKDEIANEDPLSIVNNQVNVDNNKVWQISHDLIDYDKSKKKLEGNLEDGEIIKFDD